MGSSCPLIRGLTYFCFFGITSITFAFAGIDTLNVSGEVLELIKKQTVATFNQLTKGNEDEFQLLQAQVKELTKKMDRLE